jgi:PncC family amidohydrolase
MFEWEVVRRCTRRGLRFATAESTVGGLIGHRLTDVPGASRVFPGGIAAYSNDAKVALLGVDRATLEGHGSVSEETALEMARGARRAFNVDIAVAETGIAGPAAGRFPAGTYCLAVAAEGYERTVRMQFSGNRAETKQQAANYALRLLLDYLDRLEAPPGV